MNPTLPVEDYMKNVWFLNRLEIEHSFGSEQ